MIPYVTADNFTAEVLDADTPTLVDFTASWCPPCRAVAPVLDQIDAERDDLRIVKVDVDDQQAIAARYGIMSMPTFLLFRHGQEVARIVGAAPKSRLLAQLEPALVS